MDYGHWDITHVGEFDPTEFFGFIYEIIDNESQRAYIGKKQFLHKRKKTKSNPSRYKESDWRTYQSSCEPLIEEIEKRGEDQFTFIILTLCAGRSQLTYEELQYQYIRDVLRTKLPNGERKYWNRTIGHLLFAGVEKQSDEARSKMSVYAKNRTPEHKEKIYSQTRGREFSEDEKRNLSIAQIKRHQDAPHTEETKKKISETLMGHPVSEETKIKMSLHKKTPEHLQKLSLKKIGNKNAAGGKSNRGQSWVLVNGKRSYFFKNPT